MTLRPPGSVAVAMVVEAVLSSELVAIGCGPFRQGPNPWVTLQPRHSVLASTRC
jgi:hypothetical protein